MFLKMNWRNASPATIVVKPAQFLRGHNDTSSMLSAPWRSLRMECRSRKGRSPQRRAAGPELQKLLRRDQLFLADARAHCQWKVETIKVHHLVPGTYKVMDELLRSVRTS